MSCHKLLIACASGLLIATPAVLAVQDSRLRRLRGSGDGDWGDSEVKLCTFDAKDGFDRAVKVFADDSDNSRYASFARPGYIEDEGFIESMVKCKGAVPESCRGSDSGCSACPCDPDLKHNPYGNYQRRMLELLTPRCNAAGRNQTNGPFRVLLVGLGGGALAQYVENRCPSGTEVEAIEYDGRMIEAATRFFGLHPQAGILEVIQGEGGAVVAARAKEGKKYDVVLIDVFAGGPKVPETCRSAEFVGNLGRILTSSGVALHNINVEYEATLPLYEKAFGRGRVSGETLTGNGELPSHLIVAKVAP